MTGCRCTVATCNNSLQKTRKSGQNVSYHNFPKNPEITAIWVQKCRCEGKWNYGNCRVCSVHFTEHDYEVNKVAKMLIILAKHIENIIMSLHANTMPFSTLPICLFSRHYQQILPHYKSVVLFRETVEA
ncbi:hypothetical protein RI129_001307 [Pyrocoelia pectoralis]|uniref:THAP-type domain-containing protein n=1 Tax=Pyrocoelia pectoralis TaxID=417401 RepID=A0AAN7VWI1_9COLE